MSIKYVVSIYGKLSRKHMEACQNHFELRTNDVENTPDIILLGQSLSLNDQTEKLTQLLGVDNISDTPFIVFTQSSQLETTLKLFDAGADDVISEESSEKEVIARLQKSILNKIATKQLRSQLMIANDIAYGAMTDNSELGANIQFLIDATTCENLDHLGLRLYQTLDLYGLRCSLQFRGRFQEKNMERNGMAREMESQLLRHFHNKGRFHQAGPRLFVNYGQVSLLIKNLPENDSEKCSKIKDSIITLVRGADARVKALDEKTTSELELELLRKVSQRMQSTMHEIDETYKQITDQIVKKAEDTTEKVYQALHHLGLTEEQEHVILEILQSATTYADTTFKEKMAVETKYSHFINQLSNFIEQPMEDWLETLTSSQESASTN